MNYIGLVFLSVTADSDYLVNRKAGLFTEHKEVWSIEVDVYCFCSHVRDWPATFLSIFSSSVSVTSSKVE